MSKTSCGICHMAKMTKVSFLVLESLNWFLSKQSTDSHSTATKSQVEHLGFQHSNPNLEFTYHY